MFSLARRVKVIAGARLHLGFYSLAPVSNHMFGSLGLYIGGLKQDPLRIEIEAVKRDDSGGLVFHDYPNDVKHVVLNFFEKECNHANLDATLKLVHSYRRHVGLGSTTQLVLASLTALSRICGYEASVEMLALKGGRGSVSGIGIYGFKMGGFIVDSGVWKGVREHPVLLTRLEFPEDIGVIIAIPKTEYSVPESEEPAIEDRDLIRAAIRYQKDLSTYALSYILRGLVSRDWSLFAEGLNKLQDTVGKVFKIVQGGLYATEETETLVGIFREKGALGAGQSSWGPLAYGFFRRRELGKYMAIIEKEAVERGVVAEFFYALPNNRGARIFFSSS